MYRNKQPEASYPDLHLGDFLLAITAAESETDVYSSLAIHLPNLLPCDRCSVTLLNSSKDRLEIFALSGNNGILPIGKSFPLETSLIGLTVKTQQTLYHKIHKNLNHMDAKGLFNQGMSCCISSPIFVNTQIIGTINIAATDKNSFDASTMSIMTMVSSLISTYLEKIQSQSKINQIADTYRSYAKNLKIVSLAAEELSTASIESDVFECIASAIQKIIPVKRISYLTRLEDHKNFRISYLYGNKVLPVGAILPIKGSIFEFVENSPKGFCYFNDFSLSQLNEHAKLAKEGMVCGWSVIVNSGNKSIGVLNIACNTSISHIEKIGEVLITFAGIMGATLWRISMQNLLKYQAAHDRLTGLPNRYELDRELYKATLNDNIPFALMFIDLDNFKGVNDTLGHTAGDELLCTAVQRIQQVIGENDFISRFGGDEFALVLKDIKSQESVEQYAQEIIQVLKNSFNLHGKTLFVGASIGISLFPYDSHNIDELLKSADLAMYHAKNKGRNCYQFYSVQFAMQLSRQQEIQQPLHYALENNECFLVYQPIILEQEMIGIEALMRWSSAQLGLVPPSDFIPIAEKNGFIKEITRWVLQESLLTLKSLRSKHPNLYMSVNISAQDCADPQELTQSVSYALEKAQLPGSALELEITESVYIQDKKTVSYLIKLLQAQGVRIALDDFGTGYSSLTYLLDLPVDTFKIDKSFIDNIHQDAIKKGIVKGIVEIANSLNMRCVAEGIERQAQLNCLIELGVERFQGYFFSKPLTTDDLLATSHHKLAKSYDSCLKNNRYT